MRDELIGPIKPKVKSRGKKEEELEKVIIIPDVHYEIRDKRAWNLVLKVMREWKPKRLIQLGDFGEYESVSSHRKSSSKGLQLLSDDIKMVKRGLDELDQVPSLEQKVMIFGNHENRVDRYIDDNCKELYTRNYLAKRLGLELRGWEWRDYGNDYKLGKLYLTHDVNSAGANAVVKALSTYQGNVVTGHTHRIQYIVEGNAKGEQHFSCIPGWLGSNKMITYKQKQRAKREYVLGFAVMRYNPKNGFVYLNPVPIINYTCCVEGKVYRG